MVVFGLIIVSSLIKIWALLICLVRCQKNSVEKLKETVFRKLVYLELQFLIIQLQ